MNALIKMSHQKQNESAATTLSPKKSLFSFIEQRNEEKSKSVQVDVIMRKRQYLERNNLTENTNPLLFWKINEELNPLPNLCKKYLCIPTSSTESERTFSTIG